MGKKEREEFIKELKNLLKKSGFKSEDIQNIRIHVKPDLD